MEVRLRSEDFRELATVKPLADDFEREYSFTYQGVTGVMRETVLEGVVIEQRSVSIQNDLLIEVKHNMPLFKMQFELSGHSIYHKHTTQGSLDVEILQGQHNLFYFPEVNGLLTYPGPLQRSTLEIYFTVEYVSKIFGGDLQVLGILANAITNEQAMLMSSKSLSINPELKKVIHDIVNCPFSGSMRKAYLGAKVAELLIMQLQVFDMNPKAIESKVHACDVEKYYLVKECIEHNLAEPYSVEALSLLAGMSATKLKSGFKKIFHLTMAEYLVNTRMAYARDQLKFSDKSISAIAAEVGFKNPQHFTTAFKRKFGYTPSEER